MDDSFVILQSERSQFGACGPVLRVKNASNSQTFRDLDEHRGVFDVDYLPGGCLSDVQRRPKDVRVGLADVDEAGANKRIHKPVQLEIRRRPFAGMMIPPVGEQDTADVRKQCSDWHS